MKDCKKTHPLLSLHAEGSLTPQEAKKVEAHLASCADARQELEGYRRIRRTLLALPEPAMPKDLHEKIMGRVTGKLQPLRPHKPFLNFPIAGLAVAACLVLYIVVSNPEMMRLSHPAKSADDHVAAGNGPAADRLQASKPQTLTKTFANDQFSSKNGSMSATGVLKEQEIKPAEAPPAPFAEERTKRAKKSEPVLASKYEGDGQVMGNALPQAPSKDKSANFGLESAKSSRADVAPAASGAAMDLDEKQKAPQPIAAGAAAPRAQLAPAPVPTEGSLAEFNFSKKLTASTWSGNSDLTMVEGAQLITGKAEFEALWDHLRPNETVPAVDFAAQAVVLLSGGDLPGTGYRMTLTQMEDKGDVLLLHYRTGSPANPSDTVTSRPWTLQVISKPSLPVQFQKD